MFIVYIYSCGFQQNIFSIYDFLKNWPNNKKDKDKTFIAKLCTKVYHIIYSLCKSTYVEFKKLEFIFYDFFVNYDFQRFNRNN